MSLRFFHCKNHIFHDLNGLLRNLPSTFVAAPFGSPTAGSSTPAPALSWPQKRQNLGNRIMKSYQCQPGTKPNIWRTSYLNISITIFKAIWKKDTHTHKHTHLMWVKQGGWYLTWWFFGKISEQINSKRFKLWESDLWSFHFDFLSCLKPLEIKNEHNFPEKTEKQIRFSRKTAMEFITFLILRHVHLPSGAN